MSVKKKILITGGSGLLGQYVNIALSKQYDILTLYGNIIGNCIGYNNRRVNLADAKAIQEVFEAYMPDIVVHLAAIANPQLALRTEPHIVNMVNVNATEILAQLCKQSGSLLVYTSTDLVYAGYRGGMLKETAKLAPKSLYAETKLMGEVKIQRIAPRYLILRTALLIGSGIGHTSCSFEKMVLDLHNGKPVSVFTDQIRTPLFIHTAAEFISILLDSGVENTILNFAGDTRVSRAELAEMVCNIGGFDSTLLNQIPMDAMNDITPVEDVSLDTTLLKSAGVKYPDFMSRLATEIELCKRKEK